jgi:tetratricopeptide (TPR) repeat protein
MSEKAKIWEEDIIIPTYKVYPAEKNPLFIEKRAYQGSTGKVYPLPVTEKISDKKEDVSYHAVMLENKYLKVMVLPELGGRIQRAYDKTNGYDFVYYNHVIKPALVGLAGPWISGGIEFNWPQHHRPSTFSPVDYAVLENRDGSVTVCVGEIDKMYGTKGMAKISLYPDKAYIEIKGQLYNHTELPQTFLWWANPAVSVNDYTYSVFPPDVNAVMDHGKRAVSTFPIATGEYYKQDYSAGVDISRYKNIKVPTSYMAAESDFDFIGNYDESVNAGLLHIADHHVSPGKKQWTWGNGDFGRTWDNNLTDEDGPYIELMTGVFTDNQPDFTWLKPHEEKSFVQYFMPYKGVGRVCNATKEAAISFYNGKLKVYVTSDYSDLRITVEDSKKVFYDKKLELTPKDYFSDYVEYEGDYNDCHIKVSSGDRILAEYKVYRKELKPIPSPAKPMEAPIDIKSVEDLWLSGMHLEQYRHATYEPADYYEEGLRREPNDIRINNSYGQLLYKRGLVEESISYFKKAINKQTWRNPNPYYGESYYNLGLVLSMVGQDDEAYDAFYKATWSMETQGTAFYQLASLSARKGDYQKALEFTDQSLVRNWHDVKARGLKIALMRKLGVENRDYLSECEKLDILYMGYAYERMIISNDTEYFKKMMRNDASNFEELALDYMNIGFYNDAKNILLLAPDNNPMCEYYLGYACEKSGEGKLAIEHYLKAEQMPSDYIFPNRIEEIFILKSAIKKLDNNSPMAHYYLGNLYYDKKQYELAAHNWIICTEQKPDFATAYRNLAIYYYNKKSDQSKALENMEKACGLDGKYPRIWLEYDQLAARLNIPYEKRLECMENHMEEVVQRDDLFLRYITLQNSLGMYEKAYENIMSRTFHPWEGGEGKVTTQYKYALINLALKKLNENKPLEAIELLERTLSYPNNLGEGKLPDVHDNEAYYYMGEAYKLLGNMDKSKYYLELATSGDSTPNSVLYYNDQPSDYIYYQGMAYVSLGLYAQAKKSFNQLTAYGERHMFDKVGYDYFAVSLPEIEVFQEDIQLRNDRYCEYLRKLGLKGLDMVQAIENSK